MEIRGVEPPLDLELREVLSQAKETLQALDETHRAWAADRQRTAALAVQRQTAARAQRDESRRAAVVRAVWSQLAERVPAVDGGRVTIQLDPEMLGIPRDLMPTMLRQLGEAADADPVFWLRTRADGVEFQVTPEKPEPAASPVPTPTGPARTGAPRPGRYR